MPSTYYISAAGNDSNDGSLAHPWLTLSHAASASASGDTLNLNGGDSFVGGVSFTSRTIRSYGTGNATITTTGDAHGLQWTNCGGIDVQGVNFTGDGTSTSNSGVYVTNTTGGGTQYAGVIVRNCSISGFAAPIGIQSVGTDDVTGYTGVDITRNILRNAVYAGIYLGGTYTDGGSPIKYPGAIVSYNEVCNVIGGLVTTAGIGIIVSYTGTGAICEHNLIYNCDGNGSSGILFPFTDGLTVQNNAIFNQGGRTSGTDAYGIDPDINAINCIIQYNLICASEGPGIFKFGGGSNNVIRFNVCIGNSTIWASAHPTEASEINVTNGDHNYVYGNTVFTTVAGVAGIVCNNGTPPHNLIANNIIQVLSGDNVISVAAASSATTTVAGNQYWDGSANVKFLWAGTTYTGLPAFRTGSGQETGTGYASDPKLQDTRGGARWPVLSPADTNSNKRYAPLATSNAIGNGLDLSSLFSINPGTQDMNGNAIPVPYNIGAYNFTAPPAKAVNYAAEVQSEGSLLYYARLDSASTPYIPQLKSATLGGTNMTLAGNIVVSADVPTLDSAGVLYCDGTGTSGTADFTPPIKYFRNIMFEFWIKTSAFGTGDAFDSLYNAAWATNPGSYLWATALTGFSKSMLIGSDGGTHGMAVIDPPAANTWVLLTIGYVGTFTSNQAVALFNGVAQTVNDVHHSPAQDPGLAAELIWPAVSRTTRISDFAIYAGWDQAQLPTTTRLLAHYAARNTPGPVTNLVATPGSGSNGLSWTASPNASSSSVYRGTSAAGESLTPLVTGVAGTTYTDSTAVNGTTYYYQVEAVGSGGVTSALSNEASATPTSTPDTTAPAKPTNLQFGPGALGAKTFSWDAVAPVGGETITYVVKRRRAGVLTTLSASQSANTYTIAVVDQVNNDTYLVAAKDDSGNVSPFAAKIFNPTDEEIMIPIDSATVSVPTGSGWTTIQDVSTEALKVEELTIDVTSPLGAITELRVGIRAGVDSRIIPIITDASIQRCLRDGNYPIPAGSSASFVCSLPAACDSVVVQARHNAAGSKSIISIGSLA